MAPIATFTRPTQVTRSMTRTVGIDCGGDNWAPEDACIVAIASSLSCRGSTWVSVCPARPPGARYLYQCLFRYLYRCLSSLPRHSGLSGLAKNATRLERCAPPPPFGVSLRSSLVDGADTADEVGGHGGNGCTAVDVRESTARRGATNARVTRLISFVTRHGRRSRSATDLITNSAYC